MPSKNQKSKLAVTAPHLPQKPAVTELPDGHRGRVGHGYGDQSQGVLADHGIYSEIVLAHAQLAGQAARDVTFEEARFERVRLNGSRLSALHVRDARFDTCDLAEADWSKAQLTRVEIVESRLLGFKAGEARIQDTVFRDCNGALALFWSATFKRVRFERCDLHEASFHDADLSGVIFDRCDLRDAAMQGAKLAGADFRGSRIDGLKVGADDLRGAIIDPAQAVAFVQLLGLVVRWEE